jgi:hypothetical protein
MFLNALFAVGISGEGEKSVLKYSLFFYILDVSSPVVVKGFILQYGCFGFGLE